MTAFGVNSTLMDRLQNAPSSGGEASDTAQLGQQAATSGAAPTGADAQAASAFNAMLKDVSASGTSQQTLQSDVNNFLAAAAQTSSGDQQTVDVAQNMVSRIQGGTYTQDSEIDNLTGAAHDDGMQGVTTEAQADPAGTESDGGIDVGAATHNLITEMGNGSSSTTIQNDANALANEANQVGFQVGAGGNAQGQAAYQALANSASNIANSISNGTYSASGSATALQNGEGGIDISLQIPAFNHSIPVGGGMRVNGTPFEGFPVFDAAPSD